MKANKTNQQKEAKKEYLELKVEKIDLDKEDIITYSWDENVPEDGWQQTFGSGN